MKTLNNGPSQIKFYREIMGGVDLAAQMSGPYEYDRNDSCGHLGDL